MRRTWLQVLQFVSALIGQRYKRGIEFCCDRVEHAAGNLVVKERQACIRICERRGHSREISVALRLCRHKCSGQALRMLSKPFIGDKEKGPIPAVVFGKKDRPSDIATKLMLAQQRLGAPRGREFNIRVEHVVADVFPGASME